MRIDEALKILGLNRNYREEDIKRTYRKLITKYHPDKFETKSTKEKKFAEEKTKQINEAKEVLEKNLKIENIDTKDFYYRMYEKELEQHRKLKKQYKEQLEDELNYLYNISVNDKIFAKRKEYFIEIIEDFYKAIDTQPNTISLKINYEIYKKDRLKQLWHYAYENWKISKVMDFVNGSDNFKVEETDNLRTVRTKMTIIINEILLPIMDEFKSYDNYKEVEPLLIGNRDGFTTLILWGYLDIETAKKDFKDKILIELIKYNKRKQMILELQIYYGYPSPLVIELYNNILNEEKFNNIYNKNINKGQKIKMKIKSIFSK